MYSRTLKTLGALSLAAALVACGGGGDDATPTTPTGPTNVVDPAGTLVTSVAPATYAASSYELQAFNALNKARLNAGAGVLAQSPQLDVAAGAHANYLTVNRELSHDESPAKPSFYAADVGSRAAKAGYMASSITELIGGGGASTTPGADCALGLLNTVYHAVGLLSSAIHVGMGIGSDGAGFPMCVINPASPSDRVYGQVSASGAFVAYPYDSQTNVLETFYVGGEVPRPSATLFPNMTAGTPVLVNVRNADYLNFRATRALSVVVTKFELKDAGGNIVPSHTLSSAGISAGPGVTLNVDSLLVDGFIVLVPQSPLAKGATYTASFSATLKAGGVPLSKTWSFTTNP